MMGSLYKRKKRVNGKLVKSPKYTIKYKDQAGRWVTETAYADRKASLALLADRERAVARGEVDMVDRYAVHSSTPLAEHVEDFCDSVRAGGASEKYVSKLRTRLLSAFESMEATMPPHVTSQKVEAMVLGLREAHLSPATCNHYIDALRQFSKWGVRRERWPTDPLVSVRKLCSENDLRRMRRALTIEELRDLVSVARTRALRNYLRTHPDASEDKRRQLQRLGESHALAYQLAALAGLRFSEIKTLAWADIDFDRAPATITIRAKHAKSKREDTVPIPDDLATELLAWHDATKAEFGRSPEPDERVVHVGLRFRDSFKKDCEAAGIKQRDALGRWVDMHALRHTYATMLARANVHPKVAQSLLRHRDIRMTLSVYTHVEPAAQAQALASLPDLTSQSGRAAEAMDPSSIESALEQTETPATAGDSLRGQDVPK